MIERFLRDRPALGVGLFTLCWTLIELIGPRSGVPPLQIVWTRYGVHLALMALVVGRRRGVGLVRTAHPALSVLASLLMLGMPVCFVLAASRMPMHDTLSIFWTAPVFIVGFGALLGQQSGGVRTLAALLGGLAGAMLIYRPDATFDPAGAVFALGMAICFALYVVLMGTMTRDSLGTKLFHTALWVFAALTFALPRIWLTPTATGLVVMAAIGVFGLGGLYVLDLALETVTPAIVAPLLYTQLAWETGAHLLRDALRSGRVPDAETLAGLALIGVAGAIAYRRRPSAHGASGAPPDRIAA